MRSSMSTFRTKVSILSRIVRLVSSIPSSESDPPEDPSAATATESPAARPTFSFSKLKTYLSTSKASSQFPLLYRALDLAVTGSETSSLSEIDTRKHKLMDLLCVFGLGFVSREVKEFESLVGEHRCPLSTQLMRRPVQSLRDKTNYDQSSLREKFPKVQYVELGQVREFVIDLRRQWGVCAVNLVRLLQRFVEYWGLEDRGPAKATVKGCTDLFMRIYELVIECASGAHWRTCEESYSELLDLAFEFYARSTPTSNASILLETLVLRIRKFVLVAKATASSSAGGAEVEDDAGRGGTSLRSDQMSTFVKEYCEIVLPRMEAYFRRDESELLLLEPEQFESLLMRFGISLEAIVRGLDDESESESEKSLVHHALRDLSRCYLACGRPLQGLRVLREFVNIVCHDLELLELLFRLLRECPDSDGDYEGLFETLLNRVRTPSAEMKILECGLKLRPASSILTKKLLRSVESGELGERDFSRIGSRVLHIVLQRLNRVNLDLDLLKKFKEECGVALTRFQQRNEELSTQNEILLGTIRSMKDELEEFRAEFQSFRAKKIRRRPKPSPSPSPTSPSPSPTREVRPPPKRKDIVWVTEDGVLVEESTEGLDTFTKYSPHSAPLPLPPDEEEEEEGELELNTVTRPKPESLPSSRTHQRTNGLGSGNAADENPPPLSQPQSSHSVRPSSRRSPKSSASGLVPYSRRRPRELHSAPGRVDSRKETPPSRQRNPTASIPKDQHRRRGGAGPAALPGPGPGSYVPCFSRVVVHPWRSFSGLRHILSSYQLDCEWFLRGRDSTFVVMKTEDDANALLRKSREFGRKFHPSKWTSALSTEIEIDFNVCDVERTGDAVKWLDQQLGREVNASFQQTSGLETLTVRARLNSFEELQKFAAPGRDVQMPFPGGFRFPCPRSSRIYWVEFTRNRSFGQRPATSKKDFYFDLLAYCGRFGRVVKIVLQDGCQGVVGFNCPLVAALLAGKNPNSPFSGSNLSCQEGVPPAVREFRQEWWRLIKSRRN